MGGTKILLYEAGVDHAELIKRTLNKSNEGYHVVICNNPANFRQELGKLLNYGLILYSLFREDDTGLEILEHPVVKEQIPVVFLSGPVDEFKGAELIRNGAIDYIQKTQRNIENMAFFVTRAIREWENINARKLAEQKLLETQSKYRLVTENINDVIWETDLKMLKFTFISASIKGLLGYTNHEFLQLKPTAVLHPDSFREMNQIRKMITLRVGFGEKPSDIQFTLDLAFYHKNGNIIWGEVRGFLVVDENGQANAVSGIVRNITMQKYAQQQLAIRDAYFETLFREAPLAIILLDNNDRIIQINEQFVKLFGYSEEEAIGQPINELIVPENLMEEGNALTLMAYRGDYIDYDTFRKNRYGDLIPVHILAKPVMLNNSKLGVLAIYQENWDRKTN